MYSPQDCMKISIYKFNIWHVIVSRYNCFNYIWNFCNQVRIKRGTIHIRRQLFLWKLMVYFQSLLNVYLNLNIKIKKICKFKWNLKLSDKHFSFAKIKTLNGKLLHITSDIKINAPGYVTLNYFIHFCCFCLLPIL